MGLNAAGLSALFDDGNDLVLYVAVGSGPAAGNQVSAQRRVVTLGAPADRVLTAANAPFAFTGTPNGPATHLLLFSAATGGTFYGSAPLTGDVAFNLAGDFRIASLTLTARDLAAPPDAPLAPYALGAVVGPPDGTTYTPTTGLGVNDGVESITITNKITGEQNTFDVTVFRHRHYTETVSPNPGNTAAYLFDECWFDVTGDNFVVDNDSITSPRSDPMHPMVIYRKCLVDGHDSVGTGIVGGYFWAIDTDIRNCENGVNGAYYTVLDHCNITATTDGGVDSHSDGVQISGLGIADVYNCWLNGGHVSTDANSAMRIGTEFSASTDVRIYYSGLSCSEVGLQMRGDSGAGDITGVEVVGCRFEPGMRYGPVDSQETTIDVWTDNALFDGTIVAEPA